MTRYADIIILESMTIHQTSIRLCRDYSSASLQKIQDCSKAMFSQILSVRLRRQTEATCRSFSVMHLSIRSNINSRYAQFPYVNGGLFAKHIEIPRMNMCIRKLILQCGELNWAKINPDIFGSMIQAVVNPELRGGLGMHYTSVSNIKKVIRSEEHTSELQSPDHL